eukprot:g12638.t1
MRAAATTTAGVVRSARRQRLPRGHQAGFVVAVTGSVIAARGRSAAASVSSSTTRTTTGGDLTKKFGDPSFWEAQYSSRHASQEELTAFEWFLPYDGEGDGKGESGLREYLLPFLESMHSCDRLLHVGCGTSDLGPKLAQEPSLLVDVMDADNSPSAIRIMEQRHANLENYGACEADVLNLDFPDGTFDAIVDKGTLDALLCSSVEAAREMVTEMHRVLRKGGAYVQVSAEDPEARLELLTGLKGRGNSKGPMGRGEGGPREAWSRHFFKELEELGGGAGCTYFMYVMVK